MLSGKPPPPLPLRPRLQGRFAHLTIIHKDNLVEKMEDFHPRLMYSENH